MPRRLLLDVSVLVALLWRPHVHHQAARTWFLSERSRGCASCPITELGTVRVLANPLISQNAVSVAGAAQLLRDFLEDQRHEFWPADLPLTEIEALLLHTPGHNQLTDRYLLALAATRDAAFATLDQSVAGGLPSGSPFRSHLEIVPV